ncbi:vascular cell adhesion protein 1-like [Engystomops pustulosus]|uniref:vascular cell adhesion protein 1-like n=1 Tax=Engystomops pustulosus TaxID=76066 RepID=UPI003AFA76AD
MSRILLTLYTVILLHQARSDDAVEFKAINSELFALFGDSVWLNCSTPNPKTYFESRLFTKDNAKGSNWVAREVVVDDWEISTMYCYLSPDIDDIKRPITVMAYALPSNVTIDMQPLLKEGEESTITCTVHDVAPQELLTINITRGGDVIDSKSYGGPHVLHRRTVGRVYTFTASRGDNNMNFSCEAILQLGREQKRTKSPDITVQTYAPPKFSERLCPSTLLLGKEKKQVSCLADGNPPPTVECKAFGRHIKNMEAVTGNMTGNYTCLATNQYGNAAKFVTVEYDGNIGSKVGAEVIVVILTAIITSVWDVL